MSRTPQIPPLAGTTPLGINSNVVPFPRLLQPIGRDEVEIAKRKTAEPIRPKAPQHPCDLGLFSDSAKQLDLIDVLRGKR